MSTTRTDPWLELLESAVARMPHNHLDLLIDQAGCNAPLLEGIRQSAASVPWCRLFEALPEAGIAHVGPLLVRIDLGQPLQRLWLEELIGVFGKESRLLALVSTWPFERLASYLGQCLEARSAGRVGLLRYYDPRLLPLLLGQVLDTEQQRQLLRPAVFWSWLDRDGRPRQHSGTAEHTEGFHQFHMIELSDAQLDLLHCASDAHDALSELSDALPREWSAERRFQACYAAMREASDAGLMADTQRQAFVLDRIHAG
ncbi:DUF4123 domain-containing protein [Pseudomonas putida]|uniref:DUF4123 domain-containing protein n=1 Tax=Pseudomonas putida TaxID=303 RepID=A0A1Q9R5E8_PSEPU|nr:DUF4123 domain-containing protein [Pseudomonas putida]OLS62623.1 hypothetical protein PSEMO_23850 [Pseudomonas putida]